MVPGSWEISWVQLSRLAWEPVIHLRPCDEESHIRCTRVLSIYRKIWTWPNELIYFAQIAMNRGNKACENVEVARIAWQFTYFRQRRAVIIRNLGVIKPVENWVFHTSAMYRHSSESSVWSHAFRDIFHSTNPYKWHKMASRAASLTKNFSTATECVNDTKSNKMRVEKKNSKKKTFGIRYLLYYRPI